MPVRPERHRVNRECRGGGDDGRGVAADAPYARVSAGKGFRLAAYRQSLSCRISARGRAAPDRRGPMLAPAELDAGATTTRGATSTMSSEFIPAAPLLVADE